MSPPLSLALVIGANVGGAIAPYFAQPAGDPVARRVPLANLITRLLTGLALLPFLSPLAAGLATIGTAPARLVVNFHTAFSLLAALVFLPLTGPVAALCERLLPSRPDSDDPGRPRYLDPNVLDSPAEALACALRETLALGDRIADMLRGTIEVFERGDQKAVRAIVEADNAVDRLYEEIKFYLIRISRNDLGEDDSRRHVEILTFTTNLEHVGDIIDKNLMELAAKKIRRRYSFSAEGSAELREIHSRVLENLRLALNVFATRDIALARRLVSEKAAIRQAAARAADSHFARLRVGRPESIETSSIHVDVIRDLKRINGHLAAVAYPILDAAGELAVTRLKPAGSHEGERQMPGRLGGETFARG